VKQAIILRLLSLRRAHPELFAQGSYRPLSASGTAADHILAFVREHRGQRLLVAVARHTAEWLAGAETPAIPAACWEGTTLPLPEGQWRNVLGDGARPGGVTEAVGVFGNLPVAAWVSGA